MKLEKRKDNSLEEQSFKKERTRKNVITKLQERKEPSETLENIMLFLLGKRYNKPFCLDTFVGEIIFLVKKTLLFN